MVEEEDDDDDEEEDDDDDNDDLDGNSLCSLVSCIHFA